MTMRIGKLFTIAVLAAVLPCAHAGKIDAIYAFGDSLSDAGNLFIASGGLAPAPAYVNGEFSNGPVWVQDLSVALGLGALTPSLSGGGDFAYGGAETGTTPIHTANFSDLTGAGGQISQFQSVHPVADPNGLYTIWIGANDLDDIPAGSSSAAVAADIGAAVGNIDGAISTLAGLGAKNFLVVGVPDLGKTPEAIAGGGAVEAAASALAAAFDSTLVSGGGGLPSLASLSSTDGLNLGFLNTYSLIDAIVANGSAYGFTNVTQPCLTGEINYAGGTPCANPSQHLFWDQIHPTAGGHLLVADAALGLVQTPEPGSVSLVAAGILGMGLLLRRRHA